MFITIKIINLKQVLKYSKKFNKNIDIKKSYFLLIIYTYNGKFHYCSILNLVTLNIYQR